MGYALKISTVDFSGVAVDQVAFVNLIPCTGILLDQNTISFDKVNDTVQLTATVTPSDTTDSVTWATSDSNVATVSNGLVTIHGIGTATITATCGEQTATASINQSSIKPQYGTKFLAGYTLENNSSVPCVKTKTASSMNAIAQLYHSSDVNVHIQYGYDSSALIEMIRVPYGATKAKIATSDSAAALVSYGFIADTTDVVTTPGSEQVAKFISQTTWVNTNNGITVEYGQCVGFACTDAQLPTLSYVYFT